MARTKLEQEIDHYLNLPYFANSINNPNQLLAVQVGKGNWQQIKKYTQILANKQNIDLLKLNPQQLYNFQKKNNIGIDCSGLAYHLANNLHQIKFNKSIKPYLIGSQNKLGPRRISANLITSPQNSVPVNSYNQIKPGDLIRSDLGRHVIFIYKKINNKLYIAHSSQKTFTRGVHKNIITITNPKKPLDQQRWLEKTTKNILYKKFLRLNYGDGIYRLKCFAKND